MGWRGLGYRWFGFLSCDQAYGLRFTWLQVTKGWGLALNVSRAGDAPYWLLLHLSVLYGHVYLTLPIRFLGEEKEGGFGSAWGGTWPFNDQWHLHWGERTKIVKMPWRWEWVRTGYLLFDGSWFTEYATPWLVGSDLHGLPSPRRGVPDLAIRQQVIDAAERIRWQMILPYRYTRRSGEVQNRLATVQIQVMEWRRWWTYWLPWGAKVCYSIEIKFDEGVGERVDSWKGGVLGCCWDLRPYELPEHALARMERERKFT